jgi:hypothetical protein
MGVVFAAIETALWLWVPAPTPNNAEQRHEVIAKAANP